MAWLADKCLAPGAPPRARCRPMLPLRSPAVTLLVSWSLAAVTGLGCVGSGVGVLDPNAVADALDAMTSNRPYRKSLGLEEALRRLGKESGRQFDTETVSAASLSSS